MFALSQSLSKLTHRLVVGANCTFRQSLTIHTSKQDTQTIMYSSSLKQWMLHWISINTLAFENWSILKLKQLCIKQIINQIKQLHSISHKLTFNFRQTCIQLNTQTRKFNFRQTHIQFQPWQPICYVPQNPPLFANSNPQQKHPTIDGTWTLIPTMGEKIEIITSNIDLTKTLTTRMPIHVDTCKHENKHTNLTCNTRNLQTSQATLTPHIPLLTYCEILKNLECYKIFLPLLIIQVLCPWG